MENLYAIPPSVTLSVVTTEAGKHAVTAKWFNAAGHEKGFTVHATPGSPVINAITTAYEGHLEILASGRG